MKAFFRLFVNPSSPLFFKGYAQLIGVTQGFRVKIILFEKLDTHFSFLLLHFYWLKFALLGLNDKRDRRLIKKLKGNAEIMWYSCSQKTELCLYKVTWCLVWLATRTVYDRYQKNCNRLSSNSIWVFLSL